MASSRSHLHDWLQLIRAEFSEVPDLQLSQPEVEEMWGLDAMIAEALLAALVSAGFLKRTREGLYRRRDSRESDAGASNSPET